MIIDAHTHIFPEDVRQNRAHYLQRDVCFDELYCDSRARMVSAEELVASMDENGVDLSVVCGFGWADHGLCREMNDYVAAAVQKYPDRLVGFMSIQPLAGEGALAEIERGAHLGLRGIGEQRPDAQGHVIDDLKVMGPIVDAARHFRLPLMIHSSEPVGHIYRGKGHTVPEHLFRFAELSKDIDVILAHWGGGLAFYELMPEVHEALQRVWYDMAASCFLYRPQIINAVAITAGLERVLFGSDYPVTTQRRMLNYVDALGLEAGDRDRILAGNVARLLRLPVPVR